mmetsp:Transcript_18720/g.30348  ORF Transcript_18720/g.30348 Transcript_18720/m.30348 type:complete len:397 (+) Transcript_18720:50-1240(+)
MVDANLRERLENALAERERLNDQSEIEKQRFQTLKVQLEDAHAAVVGYQMDCANLSARTRYLDNQVAMLQQQCSDNRNKIVSACRDEVALKQALENVANRCKLFKECETELRETGTVKTQATARFLRNHLREVASTKRVSTDGWEQLRRRCMMLTSKSHDLVAKLMSACVDEGSSSSSVPSGSIVKPRTAPRLASARRAPRTKTPPLQVRPSTTPPEVIQSHMTDARSSSSSLGSSRRPSASTCKTDAENCLLSKSSRPPLPPAPATRQPEATSGMLRSEPSASSLLIAADRRRAELEANQKCLDDNVHRLEALRSKLGGLQEFLAEACREGVEPSNWSPGLPQHIEASLSPLLGELRRYIAPDVLEGNSQASVSYRLNGLMAGNSLANGLDRSFK